MRSFNRLIEVMKTCNPGMPFGFTMCVLANMLHHDRRAGFPRKDTAQLARSIMRKTKSDHFRELASEALHYTKEFKK